MTLTTKTAAGKAVDASAKGLDNDIDIPAAKTKSASTPSTSSSSWVDPKAFALANKTYYDRCYFEVAGIKVFNPLKFLLVEPIYLLTIPYIALWFWCIKETYISNPEWLDYFLAHKPFALLIPYIIGQPLFRKFVQATNVYERNKDACKKIMAAYNIAMSVFSFYWAATVTYTLVYTIPNGLLGLGHFDEPTGFYEHTSYMFYMSKYVEFLDTYFLILCGRPVSWLQFLHHCGAPLNFGLLYLTKSEGMWIIVCFNGFIHTIMYYYYACCILKWSFPLPKPLITVMQLVQFASGGIGFGFYPYVQTAGKWFWDDGPRRFSWWVTYDYVGILIMLFSHFYVRNYVVPARIKRKLKKDAAKAE